MKDKKRILIIAWSFYPAIGGMEEQCFLLAQSFIKRGYSVDILTEKVFPDSPRMEHYKGMKIYRTSYQKNRGVLNYLRLVFDFSLFSLKHSFEYKFAILRGALTFEPLLIGLLKFLKIFRAKTFVTADTGGENDEIILLKRSKLYKVLVFFSSQHNYLNSLCDDNYNHYQELGFDAKKLTRIPNGIDISGYDECDFPESINTFLFIGRLYPYKGTRELLLAFTAILEKYPTKKLLIAGDGPDFNFINRYIRDNNFQNGIKLVGKVKREDRDRFYKRGDCLILPSYSEGFSLVVYEAAVMKRIIIATDVANFKKDFGRQIIYCKMKNAIDLANKLNWVITHYDRSKLDYRPIIKQYDINTISQEILNLMGA